MLRISLSALFNENNATSQDFLASYVNLHDSFEEIASNKNLCLPVFDKVYNDCFHCNEAMQSIEQSYLEKDINQDFYDVFDKVKKAKYDDKYYSINEI